MYINHQGCCENVPGWTEDQYDHDRNKCIKTCTPGKHPNFNNRNCCEKVDGWTEDMYDDATGLGYELLDFNIKYKKIHENKNGYIYMAKMNKYMAE